PVDGSSEAFHPEQHVDRDDDDQDAVEQRAADRDGGALDEVDETMRVFPDVAVTNALDEAVAALLDLDRAQMMGIEPMLQSIDVAVCRGLVSPSVLGGEIVVEAVRSRPRLTDDDGGEGDSDDDQRS